MDPVRSIPADVPKVLVIADDLTGALDTAAQFSRVGIRTHVAISAICDLTDLFRRFDVVSVNTETRNVPPASAARVVAEVARRGLASGADYFYKKTDSTLRGNIGAELESLRLTAGNGRLAYVPAAPHLGRTTVGGVLHVHGRPVDETDYRDDPRNPVRQSSIPALIRNQSPVPVRLVPAPASAVAWMNSTATTEGAIYVFDGRTDADVDEAAAALRDSGLLRAVAGPARLARSMAAIFGFDRPLDLSRLGRGPMLVVVGSVNPVSHRQVAYAVNRGWTAQRIPPAMLLASGAHQNPEVEAFARDVLAILRTGRPVILQGSRDRSDVDEVVAEGLKAGVSGSDLHEAVAAGIARMVGRVLDARALDTLAVFGGDTLLAIARERGWKGLIPSVEPVEGVVLSSAGELHVLSKPGGFGGEDLVVRLRCATGGAA